LKEKIEIGWNQVEMSFFDGQFHVQFFETSLKRKRKRNLDIKFDLINFDESIFPMKKRITNELLTAKDHMITIMLINYRFDKDSLTIYRIFS
jgi:hypothetical protein